MGVGNDTGISDTCLYMEDTTGDNGVHADPSATYWLSPDVIMTTTSDTGTAVVGSNTTQVTVHCHASTDTTTCPSLDEGNSTTTVFELWVGPPSLNMGMAPGSVEALPTLLNTPNPIQVASAPITGVITAGGSVQTTVTWTASANPSDPNGVGHKCLVARCYPFETSSPDSGPTGLSDHLPYDQHYAQHNLSIVAAGPGGKGRKLIPIRTGNPRLEPQLVLIQAIFDPRPSGATLAAIQPGLQAIPGFKQIATQPLGKVEFDLSAFNGPHESLLERIEDWIEKILQELEDWCRKKGGISARKVLPPSFAAFFDFKVDLSGAKPGDAYVYHLTQTTSHGRADGGLTVAIVAA
jgi:hypothetical protein